MASFPEHFPNLNPGNHRITSAADWRYNCIAWALNDTHRWWQPGIHWKPADWPYDDYGIGALELLFATFGFIDCGSDHNLEPGWQKVAIYAIGGLMYTHAARQLPSGRWTSKLGKGIDIEHEQPMDLEGPLYGHVLQIMKKLIS